MQLSQALLIVIKLGQSRVQGCLGSGDAQCIALVELLVLKDQLLEIAFLLLELPFHNGEIQGHQHLPLAHLVAHLGVDAKNLPT